MSTNAASPTSSSITSPTSPISTSPSSTSTFTSTLSSPSTTSTTTVPPTTSSSSSSSSSSSIPTSSSDTRTTRPATTTVVRTSTGQGTTIISTITPHTTPSQTSATPSQLANGGGNKGSSNGHGLSTGATTAIAVVIPVLVVAILVALGIWFWRRRKQKNLAAEERRKEVEDYGFNPNQDPRLPVVAADGPQMAEDAASGYRGWGTTSSANRKASTTLSGGHTQQFSDAGNSYGGPNSPQLGYADINGHDRRNTFGSDDLGALGAAPLSHSHNTVPIKRGVSNASSAYSAGGRSDHSDDPPPVPGGIGQAYDYTPTQGYGYSQHGPYGDGTYGGAQDAGMPVVQDVTARRNTRIQPGGSYQQGNSGIAQNF